jgi:hypothetical protein
MVSDGKNADLSLKRKLNLAAISQCLFAAGNKVNASMVSCTPIIAIIHCDVRLNENSLQDNKYGVDSIVLSCSNPLNDR